jgi:hypothetical protein
MTSAQEIAQSVLRLFWTVESGMKRIVVKRGLCPALTWPRSEPPAEPLLLIRKEPQLEENNASQLQLQKCASADWPVKAPFCPGADRKIPFHDSMSP